MKQCVAQFLCKLLIITPPMLWAAGAQADVRQTVGDDIPLIEFTTEGGVEPTCDPIAAPEGMWGAGITNNEYVSGRMTMVLHGDTLYNSGPYVAKESGMRLKVRGNTSAYSTLKPYKIKLSKKEDLFFRGDKKAKHKEYVLLLTNRYNDKLENKFSSILDMMGYAASRAMDVAWVPQARYVNVAINGVYKGLYLLVEPVSQGDRRVAVQDSGFILEYDAYWWNEEVYFKTPRCIPQYGWTYKFPDTDDLVDGQQDAFQHCLELCEEEVWGGTAGAQYIDLTSFARWLLLHDVLGTFDYAGSNLYVQKDELGADPATSRVKMGTPWDFDTIFNGDPADFCMVHKLNFFWFGELLKQRDFVSEYKRLWAEYKDVVYDRVKAHFDALGEQEGDAIDAAIKLGFAQGGYYHDTDELLAMLQSRLEMLDVKIAAMDEGTGIDAPHTAPAPADGKAYTLGGARVKAPAGRGVYVSKGRKVVVR